MSDTTFTLLIILGGLIALGLLIVAIVLGVRVWKTGKYLEAMGVGGKWAALFAVIYTISPVDLLPDPVYLDDVGVLGFTLIFLTRQVAKARDKQRRGEPTLPPRR